MRVGAPRRTPDVSVSRGKEWGGSRSGFANTIRQSRRIT